MLQHKLISHVIRLKIKCANFIFKNKNNDDYIR